MSSVRNRRYFAPTVSRFPIAATLGFLFLVTRLTTARAADPAVDIVTQENAPATEKTAADWLPSFPHVQIFTHFSTGYDSNSRTTSSSDTGTVFSSANLTLSYHLPSRVYQVSLIAGVGGTEYFGQRTSVNTFFDLTLTRNLTRRLTLNASFDGAYRSEPDLNANVGPQQFQGNYFNTNDKLWASYALTRRLSLVTSYGLHLVRYEDAATAAFTDRNEHAFGEQIRFNLTRTTVLSPEYRFLLINYLTAPLDSETHFALLGMEHQFNSSLRVQLHGGASFRSYTAGGSEINPDFTGALDYVFGKRTTLSWTGGYTVEEPAQANVVTRTTLRTNLILTHSFTGRISASLAVGYHHDNVEEGLTVTNPGPSTVQNTFDVNLLLRYQFSRRLAFNLAYDHSEVTSADVFRDYSRNRYSAGLSYSF